MKLIASTIVTEKISVFKNNGSMGSIYDMQAAALLGITVDYNGTQLTKKQVHQLNDNETYSLVKTCNGHSTWVEIELPNPLTDLDKFKCVRAAFIALILPILSNRKLMFMDYDNRYKEVEYPYDSTEFYIEVK